jgi:hypothetical protein
MLGLMFTVTGSPLRGQNPINPSLPVGERVRVRIVGRPDAWTLGNVSRLSVDTLWLRSGADSVVVPLRLLQRLDVPRGSRSNFGRGLAIGALSGTVLGALAGLASGDDPPCGDAWFCWRWSAGDKAEMGAVGFGVLGAVVGGIAGAATRSERWVRLR